jgi:hypothetical protein
LEHLASQAADHLTVVGCAAQVAESATLTKLDLSDNGIGPLGLRALSEALRSMSSLTVLYLFRNPFIPSDIDAQLKSGRVVAHTISRQNNTAQSLR